MKDILITGGGGFIGSSLALELSNKGHNVTIVDSYSEQIHGGDFSNSELYIKVKGKVRIVKDTILNRAVMTSLVQSHDIIVHYAAETGTGQSMYDIYNYSIVNIQGTALLLDIITNEKNGIEKIVLASSRSIYGEGKYFCSEHNIVYPGARSQNNLSKGDFEIKCPICDRNVELQPTSEDSRIHPSSVYGITKQVQEQLVTLIGEALNIPTVSLRYQNVYGPGQSLKNPYTGILSIFSTRILNGNPINIFEDGQESRDFVYIDDVVASTVLAIESDRMTNDIYNVGSGIGVSVEEVAERLFSLYEIEPNYTITGNYRIGDIRHNIGDLTKITRDLGFTPKVSFKDGISKFGHWVLSQSIQEDRFEQSIIEMKNRSLLK